METTSKQWRANIASLFFVAVIALAGCSQSDSSTLESPREVEAEPDPVANWMTKREERRNASLSKPKEIPAPSVRVAAPATNAEIKTTKAAVAPVTPKVERRRNFSQRDPFVSSLPRSQAAPPAREVPGENIGNEIELGNAAWTEGDFKEALDWFLKAAEQGNSEAQLNLGMMYAAGQGVEPDFAAALKWFETALAQGTLNEQQLLALTEVVMAIDATTAAEAAAEAAAIAFQPPTNAPAVSASMQIVRQFNAPNQTPPVPQIPQPQIPQPQIPQPQIPQPQIQTAPSGVAVTKTTRSGAMETTSSAVMMQVQAALGNLPGRTKKSGPGR